MNNKSTQWTSTFVNIWASLIWGIFLLVAGYSTMLHCLAAFHSDLLAFSRFTEEPSCTFSVQHLTP